ncbi:MAG TPA: hypothetical protein VGK43_04435 [Solirubrobacterales bacterium]
MTVTHLPTGAIVCRVHGDVALRCLFGEPHTVALALTHTVTSHARGQILDLAERTIRNQPGAIVELGWALVHTHLTSEWVDPCVVDPTADIVDEGG